MGTVDKKPLISVIVPVYKVEQYLRVCVDSILDQTYTNLEIILVDDGSPDNCPVMCDEYAAKDSRVKVIHKANGGLSDARNVGLSVINGEYLMFVDSDDILPLDAVKILYTLALKYDSELVIGSYTRFSDNDDENADNKDTPSAHSMTKIEAIQHMLQNGCASWGRLYRADIHENIFFPIGEINEDEAIVLDILDKCNRVILTNECVYKYRMRPESITTTAFNPQKLIWAKHCRDNLAWIRERYPELTNAAVTRYRSSLLWSLTEIALSEDTYIAERKLFVSELRQHCKLFNQIHFEYATDKIRCLMLTYLPFSLYRAFIRIKRKYRSNI